MIVNSMTGNYVDEKVRLMMMLYDLDSSDSNDQVKPVVAVVVVVVVVIIEMLMLLFASLHLNVYDCILVVDIVLFETDRRKFLNVVRVMVKYHIVALIVVDLVVPSVVYLHMIHCKNYHWQVHVCVDVDVMKRLWNLILYNNYLWVLSLTNRNVVEKQMVEVDVDVLLLMMLLVMLVKCNRFDRMKHALAVVVVVEEHCRH